MSVYISGMEMPKEAGTYRIEFDQCGNPYLLSENGDLGLWHIISVPDHGRLGDLDDVIKVVRHYLCEGCGDYLGPDAKTESCDYCRGTMLIKTIERKSSIIPADKGGEK